VTEIVDSTATRCAECLGPLPIRRDRLAIIHGPDGELTACSTACLAGLVVALAGRTREPAAGRRN
jgi:hypothetical protein